MAKVYKLTVYLEAGKNEFERGGKIEMLRLAHKMSKLDDVQGWIITDESTGKEVSSSYSDE